VQLSAREFLVVVGVLAEVRLEKNLVVLELSWQVPIRQEIFVESSDDLGEEVHEDHQIVELGVGSLLVGDDKETSISCDRGEQNRGLN